MMKLTNQQRDKKISNCEKMLERCLGILDAKAGAKEAPKAEAKEAPKLDLKENKKGGK